jgi:FkbM family methyltransferase
MRPPLRFTAASKAAIRRVAWRTGYDIVPLASGFADVQRSLLADCDLLIDVGANTGQFAERMRAFGYSKRMISFEPSSDAFNVLSGRAAKDHNWEARQTALGSEPGQAELNLSANSKSSSILAIEQRHVIAGPNSAVVGREPVTVSTLDVQLEGASYSRAFLKLDVQGYELEVLLGATKTIDRTTAVQCELSVAPLYDGQPDYLALIGLFRERGFTLVQLEPEFQDPQTGAVLQLEALFGRT